MLSSSNNFSCSVVHMGLLFTCSLVINILFKYLKKFSISNFMSNCRENGLYFEVAKNLRLLKCVLNLYLKQVIWRFRTCNYDFMILAKCSIAHKIATFKNFA